MARTQGGNLGKIVRITNPSTQREQSIRMVAYALREYSGSRRAEQETLNMAAFILAQLKTISDSVDQTTLAWEKRDYWVKADAFRRQWSWVEKPFRALNDCLSQKDISALDGVLQELSRVLPPSKSSPKKMHTPPWIGAWNKLFPES
jgi:hypothetical protein